MKYVGLFFHAPMQSWGGQNMASINSDSPKNTERHPTKSAVLGLIRSSLGVQRGHDGDLDLSEIRILTRSDSVGVVLRDYSIAQRSHHGFKAGTTKELPAYHIQEATFVVLVGHEDEEVVQVIYESLLNPMWAPFLGRRAYVPSLPVPIGILDTDEPVNTLREIPVFWANDDISLSKSAKISDSMVSSSSHTERFFDNPLSWNMKERAYGEREFSVYYASYERNEESKGRDVLEQYQAIKERFTS